MILTLPFDRCLVWIDIVTNCRVLSVFFTGAASSTGDFLSLAYFAHYVRFVNLLYFVYELFMDDNFILLTGKYLLAWTGKISLPRV